MDKLIKIVKQIFEYIKKVVKKLFSKLPRYSKIVTSSLYIFMFGVIIYTFWSFYYAGESVNPVIYSDTIKVLLGLLGITGSMKISENISEAAEAVAQYKYTGENLRGGE